MGTYLMNIEKKGGKSEGVFGQIKNITISDMSSV